MGKFRIFILSLVIATGGGGFKNLNAVELTTLCHNQNQECKIDNPQSEITNSSNYNGGEIKIQAQIDSFINYGSISLSNSPQQQFNIEQNGSINHFINYGIFGNLDKMGIWVGYANSSLSRVTNYGIMGSVDTKSTATITLNNLGLMGGNNHHIEAQMGKVLIENFMVKITETASTFNNFSKLNNQYTNFSHLVINIQNGGSIEFKDGDSKIILDFGSGFEFGKEYLINKIVTDESGKSYSALGVDFSRLIPYSDLFSLTQSGDYFIATLNTKASTIGNLYKANIRTMNNFYTLSNSMIYPKKSYHSQNLVSSSLRASEYERGNPFALSSLRADSQNLRGNPPIKESLDSALDSTLDSANPLKSYESFAYRSESQNRRIQRQNKRNYNRKTTNAESSVKSQGGLPRATSRTRNDDSFINSANYSNSMRQTQNQQSSSLRASEYERGNPQNQSTSQNLNADSATQTNQNNLRDSANRDYYFILTPFINHNLFFESGRYNLSGFDYGFLTAFSGKVAESNHLGTHFIFSYGKLGDSKDKDLSIKSLNLNIGLNYKLDLIWDMYIKARGDFFYFLNQVKTPTMIEAIKPNTFGFGVSVAYGKEWDFRQGGVLGVEVGLDYKALQSSTISLQNNASKSISETYNKALYNLLYADLGINYNKYFGNFGLNAGLGIKGNITANKLATSKIHISTFNKNIDLTLDNDMFLGYANLGASYVLNHKNFDMEFSLQYFGNFGDRVISNGGGVEWRVGF